MLTVLSIRTINTSYNQIIYKTSNKNFVDGDRCKRIYKYTCALFMKLSDMTCLKLFVSNTLYNSSCTFYIYLLSFVFDLKNRLYIYKTKYESYKQVKIQICLGTHYVANNKSFQNKNMISYINMCCHCLLPLAKLFCYI